jgi:hypothetical protein
VESVSVTLDDLEVREARAIGEMALRHYRFPDVPLGTYRVFFSDNTYTDVLADNASHAYQLTGRNDIARMVNLKFAYSHILERGVIHPSGAEIAPSLNTENDEPVMLAELHTPNALPFERMDLGMFAALSKG